MPAYNFQAQFVQKILDGSKNTTIRRQREKRPTVKGNTLKFFTGLRTKECKQFAEAVCVGVHPVEIRPHSHQMSIDGRWMSSGQMAKRADEDGFDCLYDFFDFFIEKYPDMHVLDDFEMIVFSHVVEVKT